MSQEVLAKQESKAVAAESHTDAQAEFAREAEQQRAENLALKGVEGEVDQGCILRQPYRAKCRYRCNGTEAPATVEKKEASKKGKKVKVEKAPKEQKPLPEASKQIVIRELSFLNAAWQNLEATHERCRELLPDEELEQLLVHHWEM